MNKFTKTILLALFLLIIPARIWAQEVKNHSIELELEKIENPDFRYCLLANIANDDKYYYIINDDDNTVLLFPSNQWTDNQFQTYFNETQADIQTEFETYSIEDKETRGSHFSSWKNALPKDLFTLLFKIMLIENPSNRDDNQTCATSDPFCTTDTIVFHVEANPGGSCESGPYYGCLAPYIERPPFWFHMKIGVAGAFTIRMTNSANVDIDYCCWGPFSDPVTPCPTQLTSNKLIDCGSSSNSTETCHIPSSSQVGQYYIMVITKYNQSTPTNITFQKVVGSGLGETDCGILPGIATNTGPYCVGDAIMLRVNTQEGATYHWTGPNGFNSNQQNPSLPNCTMAMAGTYTCVTTVGTHSVTATTDVTVHAKPTANFTATSVCQGQPTQFTSTSTTNPSGQTITSYHWNFGDGQTSTQQNPSHTYTTAGSKNVTLTVGIGNGACTSTKTQTVTVSAQPVANAGTDQTIIYGASASLSGSGGAGSFNYHWEPADKVVNPNAQNTQTRPLTAQQTFTLTVTSPQGNCTDSDQMIVHIEGSNMTMAPSANPTAICEGTSSQLDAHAGGGTGNFTYTWTPATGLNNPRIANPIASPTTTTTYTCTVSDGMTTLTGTATVTVNHPELEEVTHYICPGDTYNFHGTEYSEVGDYPYQTTTAQGCEKTITLHLRHYPSYNNAHTTYANICSGESYNFHGTQHSTPGLFEHKLQTVHGCDSIVWLNLNVYPDNGVTPDSVTVCPEQLPYYFYGVPYDHAVEVTHTDHDIHGCDSLVKLVLSISEYYMPDIEHQYIAYESSPSFTWPVNGQTYTTEGLYIDTLPTTYCLGVFRLDLHFMQAPEPRIEYDTACDYHSWPVSNTVYNFEIPEGATSHSFVQSHFEDLAPYHFADGRPCQQEYRLHLQMYKTSDHDADILIENACNSYTWQFGHNGESETYFSDGSFTKTIKSKNSLMHCDSIVTLTIRNMIYTPQPEIVCSDNLIEWPHHPITATEFNVNKYTYSVEDPHGTNSWINSQCQWKISKKEWPIRPSNDNLSCDVYAMDWVQDTVWLTFIAVNPCSPNGFDSTRYYLKPSFYGVQEQESYPAAVNIAPNPNNGQMQLRFENLEGKLSIKVYSLTGLLTDSFEITTSQAGETYDYSMKRLGNGVYFFVITDGKRSVTKKVVIIN